MLYLVATPIGNLKDITLRALEVLKSIDWIACEDTRRARILLDRYEIRKPLVSYHDHSEASKLRFIIERLKESKSVALITDGGAPLISDPGFPLVREAIREGIRIESIPGPCALVDALIVSGIPCEKFVFEGFLPQKQGTRRKLLESLRDEKRTMVFYESPYRVKKSLERIREILGERRVALARELTKKFEEILRGSVSELIENLQGRELKGEIILVVEGKRE